MSLSYSIYNNISIRKLLSLSSLNLRRHGTSIPVILLKKIENYGEPGDIVKVKRGYARNFLIPRKSAAYATDENKLKYKVTKNATDDNNNNNTSTTTSSSG